MSHASRWTTVLLLGVWACSPDSNTTKVTDTGPMGAMGFPDGSTPEDAASPNLDAMGSADDSAPTGSDALSLERGRIDSASVETDSNVVAVGGQLDSTRRDGSVAPPGGKRRDEHVTTGMKAVSQMESISMTPLTTSTSLATKLC